MPHHSSQRFRSGEGSTTTIMSAECVADEARSHRLVLRTGAYPTVKRTADRHVLVECRVELNAYGRGGVWFYVARVEE